MKYKVKYPNDCYPEYAGKTACVIEDYGNGLQVELKLRSDFEPDIFFDLDYAQAAYLKECLNKIKDI